MAVTHPDPESDRSGHGRESGCFRHSLSLSISKKNGENILVLLQGDGDFRMSIASVKEEFKTANP